MLIPYKSLMEYTNIVCNLQIGSETKRIKRKSVMKKPFYIQKHRTKSLQDEVVSLRNTYIHTYINPETHQDTMRQQSLVIVQQPQT